MQDSKEYIVWDSVTPKAITSSTDATPIVVTATSHGFATGDLVMIFGHATNVAANGIYKVTKLTANTFSIQNYNSGADIAGSGAGAGSSGWVLPAPKILFCQDFKSIQFELVTSGTATLTVKVVGSYGKKISDQVQGDDTPNFGATASAANPWSYIQIVDLDSGSGLAGSTGVALSGADVNKMYELNVNSAKYITFIPTAYTQGVISLKAKLFNGLQV